MTTWQMLRDGTILFLITAAIAVLTLLSATGLERLLG